ncbi:hypothetical protein D3C71_1580430 [compost metagenome]
MGFDGALRYCGHIDNTHIADLAFFDETQLLEAIQKPCIQFVVDLDIARQAQQVLLHIGESLNLVGERGEFGLNISDLCIQCLNRWMLSCEPGFKFLAFLL